MLGKPTSSRIGSTAFSLSAQETVLAKQEIETNVTNAAIARRIALALNYARFLISIY
jgi:hypothetical protein